jgi:hypothetical protein
VHIHYNAVIGKGWHGPCWGRGRENREGSVLFANIYTWKANLGEEGPKRIVNVFTNWRPPAGVEIKSDYAFADASGGLTIFEVSTAAAAYEACVAWTPFMDQKIVPLVDVGEAVPLRTKVAAWRDSVR